MRRLGYVGSPDVLSCLGNANQFLATRENEFFSRLSLMFKSVTTSCYWEKIKVIENLALLNRITYWVACVVRTDHGNDLLNNKGNAN